jgi:thymidine kinase
LHDPRFIIFTGPMFGSKTTRMLAALERFTYQNLRVMAFKPRMDDRYAKEEISTHSGTTFPAIIVSSGQEIWEIVMEHRPGVIGVDEAFMIDGSAEALLKVFQMGITVVVSSLQLSASGKVFEELRDMMPWATKIEICPAVCPVTGRDAYYTHHKVQGLDEITVGGAEYYEPRCWEHYSFINQREDSVKKDF